MTTEIPLTPVGTYHVRHAGPTARQAADDIAGLLDLGVRLIDISIHDPVRRHHHPARHTRRKRPAMSDPATLAQSVHTNGYAIWPGFLTGTLLEQVTAQANQVLGTGQAKAYPKSTRAFDLYLHGGPVVGTGCQPHLADLLDTLLGPDHLLSDLSLNSVNPNQPVDDWHIDYPFTEIATTMPHTLLVSNVSSG